MPVFELGGGWPEYIMGIIMCATGKCEILPVQSLLELLRRVTRYLYSHQLAQNRGSHKPRLELMDLQILSCLAPYL